MLLLTIIQYTPIEKQFLVSWTTRITPDVIDPLMKTISNELYAYAGGGAIISITAIVALWSASRGILSIMRGLNAVFQVEDKRNFFIVRLLSCLYTFIFLIGIILTLGLLVFGQTIYLRLENEATIIYMLLHTFMEQKWLISLSLLSLFFLLMYRVMPGKKYSILTHLPGAIFTALGWLIASSAFSFYISFSPSFSYIYGSLTAFIVFMLWMYVGMYILLLGAEINVFFRIQIKNLRLRLKNKISKNNQK